MYVVLPLVLGFISGIVIYPELMEAIRAAIEAGDTSIEISLTGLPAVIVNVTGLVSWAFMLVYTISLARSLGKSTGVGVLCGLLPLVFPVFYWIWAFGKTMYVAPDGDPRLLGEPWRGIPAGVGAAGMPMGMPYGQPMGYGQPMQGGYPQQQGGYPPQQGGYPPQHGSYPGNGGRY